MDKLITNNQLILKPFLMALAVLFTFMACSENPSDSYERETMELGEYADNSSILNSNADFPVFHQVFNHNTDPWVGKGVDGPPGWCGSIEHKDRRSNGDISPAVGRGYATIVHGECNKHWNKEFKDFFLDGFTSAPATHFAFHSTYFPESGYIQQLDIYVDPDYNYSTGNERPTLLHLFGIEDENVVFSYANAVRIIGETEEEDEFPYFAILVLKDEYGNLKIGDYQIERAGWYTFRHVFGSDDGSLAVDFELLQNGRLLYSESIDNSFLFGIPTSSLETDDLGSAHIWFPNIADGVELPIDQHRLRRGK